MKGSPHAEIRHPTFASKKTPFTGRSRYLAIPQFLSFAKLTVAGIHAVR